MLNLRLSLILIALVAILLPACDQKVFTGTVECADCYQEKPDEYFLYVYLTFNDSINEIPLVLYDGDIENHDTVYADTARAEDDYPYIFDVDVKVDREYSMSAEYRWGGKTLYTIDGTKLITKLVTESCDVDCYVVDNNAMDLEIKDEFLEK
jgi:hypothetical protein